MCTGEVNREPKLADHAQITPVKSGAAKCHTMQLGHVVLQARLVERLEVGRKVLQ